MHAIRTLLALLLIAPMAFAQKLETRPGAEVIVRIVSTNDEGFAALTVAQPEFAEKGVPSKAVVFLNHEQMGMAFESLKVNRNTTVMQAPKLTVSSERTGEITAGEWRNFVTALELKTVKGVTAYFPKMEKIHHGIAASFQPTVSGDQSFIKLKSNVTHQTIDSIVPLYPFTYFVKPTGSINGDPIPVTQFFQQPSIQKLTTEMTIAIPDQSSVAIYLGKMNSEQHDNGVPIISRIPYLNRMFKNVSSGESRHVICFVTATVVEVPVAQDYVEDYRKAVTEGRLIDAKQFAEKALAADPACFAK